VAGDPVLSCPVLVLIWAPSNGRPDPNVLWILLGSESFDHPALDGDRATRIIDLDRMNEGWICVLPDHPGGEMAALDTALR
jgi:hypothetical protein